MNIKNYMVLASVLGLFSLTSCGGGGGGDASPSGVNDNSEPPVTVTEPEPVTPEPVESTADLVVDETFVFSTSRPLTLDVAVADSWDYLTVCKTAGVTGAGEFKDCLVQTELSDGQYATDLLATNDTRELQVSLFDYQDVSNPRKVSWSSASSGNAITIRD